MRARWLAAGLICATGCFSLRTPTPVAHPQLAPAAVAVRPEVPVVVPVSSTEPEPAEPGDALTLAAECLARGDEGTAVTHLGAHVRAHPDQLMFRLHLAEMLVKLGRLAEARDHFERFVADAQASAGAPKEQLVQCHTRLMEIGQRTDDRFDEVFHRGVGLVLLAKEAGEETGEPMLCQAMRALTEAKELRPNDPRVYFYLAEAHDLGGNRRGADATRAIARNLSTPGSLTPAEGRALGASVDPR